MAGIAKIARSRLINPVVFICDIQDRFRPAIYNCSAVIASTQKVLRAAQILSIPVVATTQQRAKLGETCSELRLDAPDGIQTIVHSDKSKFSMWTPEVIQAVAPLTLPRAANYYDNNGKLDVCVVGIESHICVTQTTLDLLAAGHRVYVLADAVSSCNREEVPIALARLRAEGATVTSTESWIYEAVGDAARDEFRQIVKLVKDSKESTADSLQKLCARL